jgi:hypothetical protein
MEKEIIDFILVIVQIATLIALVSYVIKTGQIASASKRSTEVSEGILKEMRESRDQEVAPYVVAYFDIPYGMPLIYLIVRNAGKSVAKDVKLEFQPPLKNSKGEAINDIPFIKEGIGSIPPEYEIKTFFDSAISYFEKKELPLTYTVKVSYSGGLQPDTRNTEQIMDLSAFKSVYINVKGMHELVKEVETLVQYNNEIQQKLGKVAANLANGVWLKNPEFLITGLPLEPELWKSGVLAKLIEFKMLWTSIYGRERKKLVNPFLANLKNKSAIIGSQVLIIASSAPSNIPSELTDHLVEIAVKLSELGRARFYMDGDKSVNAFNELGDRIITLINETAEQIEVQSAVSDNSG